MSNMSGLYWPVPDTITLLAGDTQVFVLPLQAAAIHPVG
jgi:hypothetical protein